MNVKKMPANGEYLSWDPESLQDYDQWIDLEAELKRKQKYYHIPQGNLARAVSAIRGRLISHGKKF